jgi:hypothetical protein
MSIMKLSPDGKTLVYSTYIGGSGNEQPHSLVVDPGGNLVLAGRSNSSNYPKTSQGADLSSVGYDIVVTKLNANGTALIGSKKIGGSNNDGVNIEDQRNGRNSLQYNYGDDGRSEVILDGAGNIYVASCTRSNNFPVTAGSFQQLFGGTQDGVLLKYSPDVSNLIFSSYIGGGANDAAYVLSLHPQTNVIYVAGGTESNNLPGTDATSYQSANQGGIDGFISMVSNDGSTLIRTSYLGTSGTDQCFGVQFDLLGFPYIMGQATGSWPVQNVIWSQAQGKQFIAKMQPDLSGFVYSTKFGTGVQYPIFPPLLFSWTAVKMFMFQAGAARSVTIIPQELQVFRLSTR